MTLTYHHATAALLGRTLSTSAVAQALVVEREAILGVPFPAAVREWYGLDEAITILESYSNMDRPVSLSELGSPVYTWGGTGQEDLASVGLLVILNENQGVAQWAVRLDGTDDPEVLVRVATEPPDDGWRHYVDRFSAFIYTRVWDWGHEFWGSMCCVQAQDEALAMADLALLRHRFTEGPRTYGWPGRVNYRFSGDDTRVLLWDDAESQCDWFLFGATPAALTQVVRHVWSCGTLAQTAYAIESCGEAVLAGLRQRNQTSS